MDFIPKSNWQWVFDKQKALLILQMGNYQVDIAYKSNLLVMPYEKIIPFTVDDVARYIELFESVALKEYEGEFACKIIAHILAVELFHKPLMPKSWLYISTNDIAVEQFNEMTHVMLTSKGANESAQYTVLDSCEEFALCMLLDPSHQLTPRKSLVQFQIIKVTLDKLTLLKENGWQSFQIA